MKNIWTGEPTASMESKIKKKLLEYKIYMILRPWESEEKREREGKSSYHIYKEKWKNLIWIKWLLGIKCYPIYRHLMFRITHWSGYYYNFIFRREETEAQRSSTTSWTSRHWRSSDSYLNLTTCPLNTNLIPRGRI